jgi:[ribosomal protein S5]-alanine N-acetyltransferase
VRVRLPGGELRIAWPGEGAAVAMTGGATEVFRGTWPERPTVPLASPTLTTARLILRAATQADAPAVQRVVSDPEVARGTLSLKQPAPAWLGTWQVARFAAGNRSGKRSAWLIVERESGRVMGDIGIWINSEHSTAGMGYSLHPDHWGRGYATEAVRAVIDHCMGTLGLNSVWAGHFGWNTASGRVMVKAGMRPGRAQAWKKGDRFEDDHLHTITREQWAAGRAEER